MIRRICGAALVLAGAAGGVACLLSASRGMRDVMVTDGGFCASGGPYVIAHQCSGTDVRLLMVGIIGALVCTGLYAGGTAALGQAASVAGRVAWAALFGLFGWNFLSISGGSRITGALFWLLALGGLVSALVRIGGDLRSGPGPANPRVQPVVMAVIPPSLQAWAPEPSPWLPGAQAAATVQPTRAARLGSLAAWLVITAAGAAVGVALASVLTGVLR